MASFTVSRRQFVGGAASVGIIGAEPAAAFLPTLMQGIGVAVGLWSGYKTAEEIYNRLFGKTEQQAIVRERERIIERPYVVVPDYYRFENPYRFREFRNAEPGCTCFHRERPQFRVLLCGAGEGSVGLSSGFLIALAAAIEALSRRYATDNVSAYTRPFRYIRPPDDWRSYGDQQLGRMSGMSYDSPEASVGLQWGVPDYRTPQSVGQFIVRDRHSGVVVAEGRTPLFNHGG